MFDVTPECSGLALERNPFPREEIPVGPCSPFPLKGAGSLGSGCCRVNGGSPVPITRKKLDSSAQPLR